MSYPYAEIRFDSYTIADDTSSILVNVSYGCPAEGIALGDVDFQFEIPTATVDEARDVLRPQINLTTPEGNAALVACTIFSRSDTRPQARSQFDAVIGDTLRIDLDTRTASALGELVLRNPT